MGNDAERYRRFLDGDDNGLIEIIDEYHEGMSLYLNSIVNNMCLADDIVQETFYKLSRNSSDFESEEHIRNWLIRVAVNECKRISLSFWRKKRSP